MEISSHILSLLVKEAAEMGAKLALSQAGLIKPYLTKSEAFRLYGRKNVEHWVSEGLLSPRKDGTHSARWRIERIELEAIVKSRRILQQL